ncbi:polysaccharide deacetylase family protein [uncultured Oscillibacter sp.]|uniref:polysaccharide deacetylase family protein n=1 Tax=uncultured Oscillibacter sp. TaxID=876091 RepID=UPI002803EB6D|nr:polysaccharide deacetylase family protein [uncultured Oscillibacter sp.]
MGRGRLFFLCISLALLSGCAPGGSAAETGGDARIPEEKLIAITFDDGPRRETTERLLDGLEERDVRATFFLIGRQIEGNEDLVERMQAEGHQVGSHTWSHTRLTGVSADTLRQEVGRTEEALEDLLGPGSYWLRPPYGAVDAADRDLIQTPMIKWSIDPRDWEKLDTAQVTAAVLKAAAPNQIILLHDIYPTSVDAALAVVDALQGEGYRFVTVAELLEANGIQPAAGVLYCSGDP